MRRLSSIRAFTLIEVVIYQAVLLLFIGGLYLTLHGSMRYLRTSDEFQTVLRQAHIGMNKMTGELANTSPSSRRFGPSNEYILFLSPEVALPARAPWSQSGGLRYQKWVAFYRDDATRELRRCEKALTSPTLLPPVPTPPDFNSEMRPLPYTTLAREVLSVQFLPLPNGQLTDIVLTTNRETASDRDTRLSLRTTVRMENP